MISDIKIDYRIRRVIKRLPQKNREELKLIMTPQNILNNPHAHSGGGEIYNLILALPDMDDLTLEETLKDQSAKICIDGIIRVMGEYLSLRSDLLEQHPEWLI